MVKHTSGLKKPQGGGSSVGHNSAAADRAKGTATSASQQETLSDLRIASLAVQGECVNQSMVMILLGEAPATIFLWESQLCGRQVVTTCWPEQAGLTTKKAHTALGASLLCFHDAALTPCLLCLFATYACATHMCRAGSGVLPSSDQGGVEGQKGLDHERLVLLEKNAPAFVILDFRCGQ